MAMFWRCFYAALSLLVAGALCLIAYKLTAGLLAPIGAASPVTIDYTNIVVILLTTVTVIFSVCALALAILAVVGFRSLKRDAGKFASRQALAAISSSFDEGGRALMAIQEEFTREDGHLKRWSERRIRQEVIALLPLVIDRLQNSDPELGLDDDAPTDEGQVD
jgi:hypothetical protein